MHARRPRHALAAALIAAASVLASVPSYTNAADDAAPIDLIDPADQRGGWTLGLGREFPGAVGELTLDRAGFEGRPILRLDTDFTAGGQYVEAARRLPDTPLDSITMWLHAPAGVDTLPVRVIDGTGQCHQLKVRISDRGGWQKLTLLVREYFERARTPDALDIAVDYQKWSGANDGRWHQPGKLLTILGTRGLGGEKATLLIRDVELHPVVDRGVTIERTVRLDRSIALGRPDWRLNLGKEYAGADGALTVIDDAPVSAPGGKAMRLAADFTGGGRYVGLVKTFEGLDARAVKHIRVMMRSDNVDKYTLRMVDSAGQTHQRKAIPFTADGTWREVIIDPRAVAGVEHWGGPNDGRWHDGIRLLEIMLTTRSDEANRPRLDLADITIDVTTEAEAMPPAAAFAFDSAKDGAPPAGWEHAGNVAVTGPGHADSAAALTLARNANAAGEPTHATSPSFDVAPGLWRFDFAHHAALHAPDNSYHAAVELDVFDANGQRLETVALGAGIDEQGWATVTKSAELPAGSRTARLRITLNKTYGEYRFDAFEATPLRMGAVARRVERIELSSPVLGNLFMPEDDVTIRIAAVTSEPLAPADRVVRCELRDASGARIVEPIDATLTEAEPRRDRFLYAAEVTLPKDAMQVGRFYQLHAAVAPGPEQVTEFTGLARLPVAAAKAYAPEQIPFTIRNWDNRVPEYFALSDRLGHRTIGLWGGWSSKPPHKPQLPGRDAIRKYDAAWITGTPAASVERNGFKEYSEDALRRGMANFLDEYADDQLYAVVIGNEPHGTGQVVLDNVRAYRAIYETVKAHDPDITVISTAVEPNREYFEAGYQKYHDAYDFHIYESHQAVRATMRLYRELMEEFDAVKPIHSTELGLNSQGQTRRAVASQLIKKCAVFFAEGGATASWFTILYPDGDGNARGSLGDTHNVFDCKYNLYNPRLDAITYYHLVNGLLDKKFVGERIYDTGEHAFLFRDADGRCMAVLWREAGRSDVTIDLNASGPVTRIALDGASAQLTPPDAGLTLTVTDDPVLLLFDGPDAKLPDTLAAPALRVVDAPTHVTRGDTLTLTVEAPGLTPDKLQIAGPPLWAKRVNPLASGRVQLAIGVPANTPARTAQFDLRLTDGPMATGELSVEIEVAD